MATSVKMDEGTKRLLERLQARITLETERKVTQQELLARLVENAAASEDEIVDSFRESAFPLSEDEIETFVAGTSNWEIETSEAEIDGVLYGDAAD